MKDIDRLLAIEEIKCLKHKYFRTLDTNDWESLAECMTEDCVARYDGGKYSYDGVDNLIAFLRKFMDGPTQLTLHQGHHPEITIIDADNATGKWYLQDVVINLKDNTTLRGAGIYEDRYVKIDGRWRISHTGYKRTYEEIQKRGDDVEITSNMFL